MINSNKITNTKIGDDIHFYVNGTEDRGIVVKMNNEYVTVFKESTQAYDDIHINDTFFIKDILINKEWDKMDDDERYDALNKIHAPTPRFIMKSWNDLPKEIKELLTKNNAIETSHKDGKDDDMNRVGTRDNQSNKGEGGTGRAIGEDQTAGEVIEGTSTNPDSKRGGGGSKNIGAGKKEQGKKHGKQHIVTNPETKPDTHGHGERSESHEEAELGEGSKGSKNTTGIDYMTEGGAGIGTGDIKLGEAREQQEAKYNKQQMDKKREERGQRRSDTAAQGGKVGSKVTTAMSKLKAWQLWLQQREQEVLKEGHIQGTHSGKKVVLPDDKKNPDYFHGKFTDQANRQAERGGQTSSGQRTQARLSPKDEPISRESSKDPVMGDARKKSFFEQWLEEKSNPERSIHGNAGREPNAGVNTNTGFDASEDYEGFTHSGVRPEQFKHERLKPKVTTKERVSIGETYPSKAGQGTGDGGNPYNTVTHNKDEKGRAKQGEDRN